MKIYIAGPISGLSYDEVESFFLTKAAALTKSGHTVLSPMLGKENLRNEIELRGYGYKGPTTTNHAIFERDKWMVTQSDAVFADLSQAKRVSIGTVFELAWASFLGKHTVVVMGEVHRHAFVLEAADIVFKTEEEALDYLYEMR